MFDFPFANLASNHLLNTITLMILVVGTHTLLTVFAWHGAHPFPVDIRHLFWVVERIRSQFFVIEHMVI